MGTNAHLTRAEEAPLLTITAVAKRLPILRFQELFSACNLIVTKPKPKVELPKEEAPAEQNGPVNGEEESQEKGADKGTTESTGGSAAETTENKPDMDLD